MDAADVLLYATMGAAFVALATTILCAAAFVVSLVSARRQEPTPRERLTPATWADDPRRAAGFVQSGVTAMKHNTPLVGIFQGVSAIAALATLVIDVVSREAGFPVVLPTATVIGPAVTLCFLSLTIMLFRWTVIIRCSRDPRPR